MTAGPVLDSTHSSRFRLVIFDMDGTLTDDRHDFPAIRRDLGVAEGSGVLEHISRLTGDAKSRAEEILHAYECAAAEACPAQPGVADLFGGLADRGIKRAVLTRNSAASANRVLGRHGW